MSKQSMFVVFMVVVMVFILSGCQTFPFFVVERGSGRLVSENRPVSGFTAIQLDGAGYLEIAQGASESLEIRADDNLIAHLTADVKDNTLLLSYQERPWRKTLLPSQPVVYTLTITALTRLTVNGAADVKIDTLETDTFELEINGAGNVEIQNLSAEKLSVNQSGAGSVSLTGNVAEQTLFLKGAGNIQAGDLQTTSTIIEINGLGQGTVWATQILQVNINGGGSVSYYGSPEVSKQINGLGEVNHLGEK